ncbi:MAG: tandem-95 repeat protein, partial [Candidatus Atribacteria bacterium]
MNDRLGRSSAVAFLLSTLLAVAAAAGTTYMNDFPNVEVTEPDCYSFDITVTQESGSSATLTLRVFDVDEESYELDKVYLNDIFLGYLSGTNDTWSTTSFDITNEIAYAAVNTIRICIDPDGGETTTWRAEIDWGQILVDGGSAEDADIISVSASGAWNAIEVQTNVTATHADTYRLEINLLDSSLNNKDISSETFALTEGATTTRWSTVALPSEPAATETFTIEANLFNNTTGIQQSVKTTTWTYSSSQPPTDILLSNDHIDENLPALSLVGTLSAVDADSVSHQFTLIGGDITHFLINGNELRTAAPLDYETRSSFSLQIEAEDGDENTISVWLTITVDDVNEAPTALNDSVSVTEGASVLIDVLANDTDPDFDSLQVVSVGTASQGQATRQLDHRILYVPEAGACGSDVFTYAVLDEGGASASASVTVTIVNLSPSATNDSASTQEEAAVLIDVLANDSDPGNGALALQSVADPFHGRAIIVGDKIQYTPEPRFEGADRFSYTLSDSCGTPSIGWITVEVAHTNHPPIAHAGGFYQGVVGSPLVLDASFSSDPDIGDVLQYRWDLNGNGIANTQWLTNPRYVATYSGPFIGQIVLEVRDLYRGTPTGEISRSTALVRIASEQSIQVFVFEDLDGNGVMDSGEPGLPGIGVSVSGEGLTTEADGGVSVNRDAGSWDIAITQASLSNLQSRGFAVPIAQVTVALEQSAIETVTLGAVKTSTKLTGFVYADLDLSEDYNEEMDQLLQGLVVVLDETHETLTDDAGRFFFLSVPFGEHALWIAENMEDDANADEEAPLGLLVPLVLARGESNTFEIRWPWIPS